MDGTSTGCAAASGDLGSWVVHRAGCASSSGSQGSRGHSPTVLQEIPAALVSADGRHVTTTGRGGGAVASLALTAGEDSKTVTLSLVEVPAQCPCTANLILQPPGPRGWVRTYAAKDPSDSNLVTITQYAGNHEGALLPSIGPPAQEVVVNQAVARLWHDGGTDQGYDSPITDRHIVWQQGGYTFDVGVVLESALSTNALLDEATLLRIARGLALPQHQ